jgi:hypothetical protein
VSESIPQIRLKWNQVSGWKGLLSNADCLPLALLGSSNATRDAWVATVLSIKSSSRRPSFAVEIDRRALVLSDAHSRSCVHGYVQSLLELEGRFKMNGTTVLSLSMEAETAHRSFKRMLPLIC